jgi:hypothetical protein
MVELLGVLIAVVITGLVWGALRLLRGLRRGLALLLGGRAGAHARGRVAAIRGVRLRAARAMGRNQADRIAALTGELDRTRRALLLAEAARARPGPPEDRFRRAKQAFAVQFHPDRLRCPEPERSIRIGIFAQFWQVLRRIERG